jgi:hypothetical protein
LTEVTDEDELAICDQQIGIYLLDSHQLAYVAVDNVEEEAPRSMPTDRRCVR